MIGCGSSSRGMWCDRRVRMLGCFRPMMHSRSHTREPLLAALRTAAMSSLRISIIARVARCVRLQSGSENSPSTLVWHDLPREPVAVGEPAAHSLLAAIRQPLPVVVDFLLRLTDDLERHGLAEAELRATVDRDEPLSVELELNCHHRFRAAAVRLRAAGGTVHAGALEHRRVERGGRDMPAAPPVGCGPAGQVWKWTGPSSVRNLLS